MRVFLQLAVFALGILALPCGEGAAAEPADVKASKPLELDWLWLIPEPIFEQMLAAYDAEEEASVAADGTTDVASSVPDEAAGGIDHLSIGEQDLSDWGRAYVNTFNDKLVKVPGFMLPLSFDAGEVQEFLLVPYFGACIHVPPPPPNQIIMVTSKKPIKVSTMFEPIYVTGIMSTQTTETEFAEAGYHLSAEKVEPYEE